MHEMLSLRFSKKSTNIREDVLWIYVGRAQRLLPSYAPLKLRVRIQRFKASAFPPLMPEAGVFVFVLRFKARP